MTYWRVEVQQMIGTCYLVEADSEDDAESLVEDAGEPLSASFDVLSTEYGDIRIIGVEPNE